PLTGTPGGNFFTESSAFLFPQLSQLCRNFTPAHGVMTQYLLLGNNLFLWLGRKAGAAVIILPVTFSVILLFLILVLIILLFLIICGSLVIILLFTTPSSSGLTFTGIRLVSTVRNYYSFTF